MVEDVVGSRVGCGGSESRGSSNGDIDSEGGRREKSVIISFFLESGVKRESGERG